MAMKLEIRQRFGKLQYRVYKMGAKPNEYAGDYNTTTDLVAALPQLLDDNQVGDDTVIFHDIGYDEMGELFEAVRLGVY